MHKPTQVKRTPRWNAVMVLVVIGMCAAMLVLPGFKSPFGNEVVRARARVIEVDNTNVQQYGIVRAGEQTIRARILSRPYRDQETLALNSLLGKMETDKMFAVGDTALLVLDIRDNEIANATAYDHYRLHTEALLVALFAAMLIGFAGWAGLRALLSFAFALLTLWKVLLPAILAGQDPVWIALAVVAVLSAATLLLVAGVNRTALVALLGSVLGLVLTCSLALVLLPPLHLHGAVPPFTETLLYAGFEHLNLTRLFIAAIFVGASGAVIDVAIDIATAMSEVVDKRPDLSRLELVRSGFTVGRNMTSTMVTTLLMAYASGYMALLMVFMAQGVPPLNALNTNYVAAELLKTVVGSLGLVTVAPFTAVMGSLIYLHRQPADSAGEPASAAALGSAEPAGG